MAITSAGGAPMRPWTRGLVSMLIAAALLAIGASCTSNDSIVGPSAEPSQQPTTPPSQESTPPNPLLEPIVDPALQLTLQTVHLLTCSPQPYAQTKAVVGPDGRTVVGRAHRLPIAAEAVLSPVTITAEQMRGTVNSVLLQPAGLKLAKAATLTLSYSNCLLPPLTKRVVYPDEQL